MWALLNRSSHVHGHPTFGGGGSCWTAGRGTPLGLRSPRDALFRRIMTGVINVKSNIESTVRQIRADNHKCTL